MANNCIIDRLLTEKLAQVTATVQLSKNITDKNYSSAVPINKQIKFKISFDYKSLQTVIFCALMPHELQAGRWYRSLERGWREGRW